MLATASVLIAGCSDIAGREALVNRLSTTAVVASDEPYATTAGREALESGGNAVDAAVAMALTMTVTLPSRVGLAGGGLCLVRDGVSGKESVLAFPAEPAGAAAGLPAFVRGLTLLHEAGARRWEEMVAPAERLARFGHPVSRAMATDLAAWGRSVPLPGWQAVNPREAEGVLVRQMELSATLGVLRARGAGALLNGQFGQELAAAGRFDRSAFAQIHPQLILPANTVSNNGVRLAIPPLEARTSGPTAGLIVLDAQGTAVACRFSMGGLFGTAQAMPGSGVLLAAPTPLDSLAGVGIAFGQSVGEVVGVFSAGDSADRAVLLQSLEAGAIEAGQAMAQLPRGGNLATAGFCPTGTSDGCRASADPRGHGLALDLVR